MRERTLVGLFVLIAGGLLIGTMLAISGGFGASAVPHRAYFKFAGGVQSGAPVRYGGLTVGKVTRVRVDPGNSTRIEIDIAVDRDAPVKTDSVAKISTLGPLTDNYIEIATGTQSAPLAPPGSELPSAEAFGLPQLGDAAQAMLPDIHNALQKVNQSLDGLQVTIARANDLLNDRNRAAIGQSLDGVNHLVAGVRPQVTDSLNNLNGLVTDARTDVHDLNAKLGPLLDDVKTIAARANDTLSHVDSTLLENRPDIRAAVVRLRDTMTQLNQTLDQNSANIDELLDNIRMSTENLRSLTETLERAPASLIRGIKVPERKPGGPN